MGTLRFEEAVSIDRRVFPDDLRYDRGEYERRLAQPGAQLWGSSSPELAAFYLLAPDLTRSSQAFLDVLAVHPARQGEGLGRAAVLDAIARSRSVGFQTLAVMCPQFNQNGVDLVAFYSSLGFSVAGSDGRFFTLVRALRENPPDRRLQDHADDRME